MLRNARSGGGMVGEGAPALPEPALQVKRQMVNMAAHRISPYIFEEDGLRAFRGDTLQVHTLTHHSSRRRIPLRFHSTFVFQASLSFFL